MRIGRPPGTVPKSPFLHRWPGLLKQAGLLKSFSKKSYKFLLRKREGVRL
ncbi:MAG: hypothetical protein AVDCRST_MAG56-4834 [uncultured Cytophagales bacterium]|uniref:Uncharacterized protein n=1 Tax=uncultured Cytophagales bacterium TaxID=158755 RepID=A0A6J4K246_9SPHI|nr:MAG: hypothetical protein AVDCRST_MAG56-4834 [uncultured Cytophagales bacterium]